MESVLNSYWQSDIFINSSTKKKFSSSIQRQAPRSLLCPCPLPVKLASYFCCTVNTLWDENKIVEHHEYRLLLCSLQVFSDSPLTIVSCQRFANEEFEQGVFEGRVHDTVTHETVRRVESVIEFTNISGAGLLHNQRSPAVLAVYKCPVIMNVNITNCASHGISLISPQDTVSLLFNW